MLDRDREERRVKKAKITLMRNPKFALWSGILMVGKTSVDDKTPTAYTNGRDEVYGRKFVQSLTDKELAFVVLHENLHKAFRHLFVWKRLWEEDARLANMACDYVINLMLVNMDGGQEFMAMPMKDGKPHGLLDTRFANMSAKQVFDILKQEKAEGGEGGGQAGEGFDEHGWDEAQELTAEETQQLEKEIDRALRQGEIAAKRAGTQAGDADRAIHELLQPEVNWKEALREFVKSMASGKDSSSWRKPNRRFLSSGVYMPTLVSETIGRLAIGVDTSGSIGNHALTKFLSEVKAIAEEVKPAAVDLIYWDSAVAAHEEYDISTLPNIVSTTKPKGGGGTDPTAMENYLKSKNIKPECIVMLTDGYIDKWGDNWNAPIIWAITGGGRSSITAPVGKTIHIKED